MQIKLFYWKITRCHCKVLCSEKWKSNPRERLIIIELSNWQPPWIHEGCDRINLKWIKSDGETESEREIERERQRHDLKWLKFQYSQIHVYHLCCLLVWVYERRRLSASTALLLTASQDECTFVWASQDLLFQQPSIDCKI